MKHKKSKADIRREFVASTTAIILVASCSLCVTPHIGACIDGDVARPHISLVRSDPRIEDGISAGFFLPTEHNIEFRAAIPAPQYDIGVVDIRTINVFREGDRAQIVANIDPFADVLADNVIGAMHPCDGRNFADETLTLCDGKTAVENILTGEVCAPNSPCGDGREIGVIAHRNGSMVFSSPSEIFTVHGEWNFFPRDGERTVGLFKIKSSEPEMKNLKAEIIQ